MINAHLRSMLMTFCDKLEDKVLDRDPRAYVSLKSIPRRPDVYMVVITAGSWQEEEEAYEIDLKNTEFPWIKVYG